MEALQRKRRTLLLLHILAQLHNLQLAQRVVQISRIARPTLRLHLTNGSRLVPLLHEEVLCLLDRPGPSRLALPGMQFDRINEPRIPQQRILQLPQPDQPRLPNLFRRRRCRSRRISLIQHHLLAVVSPSLNICVRSQQLANLARKLWHP